MIRALVLVLLTMITTSLQAETLKLAVTTSFNNSGLSDVLVPEIKRDTGIDVQLLIVGTGQALRLGEAGDVDAILVHSKRAEAAFVEAGFGTHRREIMYNDFVFVGPADDLAAVGVASSANEALQKIATTQSPFVSRGDESGTHKMEMALWDAANLDATRFAEWYKPVGAGMGAALNTAAAMGAYIISDRASWLNFANKRTLTLLYAGDPALFNQYAYIPVNPARHTHVNDSAAGRLETWLTSDRAKVLINGYTLNDEPLFTFNALPE